MKSKRQTKKIVISLFCASGIGLVALIAFQMMKSQENVNEAEIPTNDDASGERQNNTHSSSINDNFENGTKKKRNSRRVLPPKSSLPPNTGNPSLDVLTKRGTNNGNNTVGTIDPITVNLEVKEQIFGLEQNNEQHLITSPTVPNNGAINDNENDSHSESSIIGTVEFDSSLFDKKVKEYANDKNLSAEEKKNLLAENKLSKTVMSKLEIKIIDKILEIKNEGVQECEEDNVDNPIEYDKLKVYYIPATGNNNGFSELQIFLLGKGNAQNNEIKAMISKSKSYYNRFDSSYADGAISIIINMIKSYIHHVLVIKPYYYYYSNFALTHQFYFYIFSEELLVGSVEIICIIKNKK